MSTAEKEPRSASDELKIVKDATCTFCGCVCDDMELTVENNRITKAKNACILGKAWFFNHAIEERPDATIAGEPVMIVDGFRYIQEDGDRLGWTSTGLLIATIALCFRSLRWVLVPIAVVQLTLVLTRAVLDLSQIRLSMVS